MPEWRVRLAGAANTLEMRYDRARVRLRLRLGLLDPLRVILYRGYGNAGRRVLRGRVVSRKLVRSATSGDSAWRNLRDIYRRFAGEEIPAANVVVRFADDPYRPVEATTDDEGFFLVEHNVDPLAGGAAGWRDATADLLGPLIRRQRAAQATGQVLVPPPTAEYVVVSDIDDTIVRTGATSLLTMARIVLFSNAHTRLPFQGVAAFYAALGAGASGRADNPLFYVSSGPWNLYDLLIEFMEINRIPLGPLFLQDWGLGPRQLFKTGHREHKIATLRTLLEAYPDLPFVLIGDSGELDATIYSEVARAFPGRIRAIYIRDARLERRAAAVRALAEESRGGPTPLVLAPDTVAAAAHAVELALIRPEALAAVRDERARDRPIPPLAAWRRGLRLARSVVSRWR